MRIVACPSCHAQFDVTDLESTRVRCHCGAVVEVGSPRPVDAEARRCPGCGAPVEARAEQCGYCGGPLVRAPGALSLVCPECCARNPEGARFCTACGVEFHPLPVEEGARALPCPGCGGKLVPRALGEVRARECPDCHGLWLETEAFETLVRRAIATRQQQSAAGAGLGDPAGGSRPRRAPPLSERSPAEDFTVRYRHCPVCGGIMQRRNYGARERRSGVIVDWCGEHGLWLDVDELELIVEFVVAGGLASRPPAEGTGAAGPNAGSASGPGAGLGRGSGAAVAELTAPSPPRSWLSQLLDLLVERC